MPIMAELIVDGALAVLLIAVMVVCMIVYKRLQTIKEGQSELQTLVESLNTAVLNAQNSVSTLKNSSIEVEARLQQQVSKAEALADELSLMTEAGNNLADRIEHGLTNGQNKGQVSASSSTASAPTEAAPSTKEQQELLAALREAR